MARVINTRDISPILDAAEQWVRSCLIEDHSTSSRESLWTVALVDAVYHTFVEHPDVGEGDFIAKLKRHIQSASATSQHLLAQMLWALLLFPSNMKAAMKRQQVREIWALSGEQLAGPHPLLGDDVLVGMGSGGPETCVCRTHLVT